MVEFITVKDKELQFGDNNFFEVASKKAVCEDGEKNFVSITRGYYNREGEKKFTKMISIPDDGDVLLDIAKILIEYATEWKK